QEAARERYVCQRQDRGRRDRRRPIGGTVNTIQRCALAMIGCLMACGPKPAPRGVSSSDAIILIKSNVADAQVYVDGRLVAQVGALRKGIAVDPGKHRLELRRDDFFSRYIELDLHRAEQRGLELDMVPVLP